MARVTVEDCIRVVSNRYELVLLAAQRARDIAAGSPLTVDRDNDKNTVVALREVADQSINLEELRRNISGGVNRTTEMTQEDDAMLAIAQEGFQPVTADMTAGLTEISELNYEGGDSKSTPAAEEDDEPAAEELGELEADVGTEDFAAANH